MNKCVICGRDSGKGKTCGSTCRSKLARSVAKATVKPVDATVGLSTVATPEQPDIKNYGKPNCECRHCQQARANKSKNSINHGPHKSASQLAKNEINRVSLPGDLDYDGVCLDPKYDDRRIAGSAAPLTALPVA